MADDLKYCVECGREKKTIAFSRDLYCSENCRKSMTGEGPKVPWVPQVMERAIASGQVLEFDPDRLDALVGVAEEWGEQTKLYDQAEIVKKMTL